MITGTDLLKALPVAVYVTDAEGRLTFFNDAAAALWGRRPELNTTLWSGAWRLRWPDGTEMPHAECPMALSLKSGEALLGLEAIVDRPDGTSATFQPHPTLLRDEAGVLQGGLNVLIETSARKKAAIDSAHLAAIVASSDDAIISKTLDGKITSWNASAERIFGYAANEMVGASILKLIPAEHRGEEEQIIAKLKRGERIEHFDTVRVGKDGRRIDLSITVSPIRDESGRIVGASKVARDVTSRKQDEALQQLLFDELNHRVKNTLATIQAIASQSLRKSASPADFVTSFNGRVQALARAHDLLVQGKMKGADIMGLIREQVVLGAPEGMRVSCSGPYLMLDARVSVQLALVLHELATNARKYGALSSPKGQLMIAWRMEEGAEGRELRLNWQESGIGGVKTPERPGFGSTLIQRTLQANGGGADLRYDPAGVVCDIRVPLSEKQDPGTQLTPRFEPRRMVAIPSDARLRGTRVLLIEDESLIGMDIEAQLDAAGCVTVGPAPTLRAASEAVAEGGFDMALVDCNLAGERTDAIAQSLAARGIPFAFVTGYGREGLPTGFRDVPILAKPFTTGELLATLGGLLQRNGRAA